MDLEEDGVFPFYLSSSFSSPSRYGVRSTGKHDVRDDQQDVVEKEKEEIKNKRWLAVSWGTCTPPLLKQQKVEGYRCRAESLRG